MAIIPGKRVKLNNASFSAKADQLYYIAKQIAEKIYEVDDSIINLVKVGIEGTAVATAAATYKANRDVISVFVAQIASTAVMMDEYAKEIEEINNASLDAATSKPQ